MLQGMRPRCLGLDTKRAPIFNKCNYVKYPLYIKRYLNRFLSPFSRFQYFMHLFILNCNLHFYLRGSQTTNAMENIFPFYHTVIFCTLQCVSYWPWSFISEYLNILIRLILPNIGLIVVIKRETLRVNLTFSISSGSKTNTIVLRSGIPLIFIIFPYFS